MRSPFLVKTAGFSMMVGWLHVNVRPRFEFDLPHFNSDARTLSRTNISHIHIQNSILRMLD